MQAAASIWSPPSRFTHVTCLKVVPPPHNSLQTCQSASCQLGCKAGTLGAGVVGAGEEGAGVLGDGVGRDIVTDSTILPFKMVPLCTVAWKVAIEAAGINIFSTTLPASIITLTSDSSTKSLAAIVARMELSTDESYSSIAPAMIRNNVAYVGSVGRTVGAGVGAGLGAEDGEGEGDDVGNDEGAGVGSGVGGGVASTSVGVGVVGVEVVGSLVGAGVGLEDGEGVGALLGEGLGVGVDVSVQPETVYGLASVQA